MTPEKRIRNLSTRWLKLFKLFIITAYVALCITVSYALVLRTGTFNLAGLGSWLMYLWFFYLLIRMTVKLQRVEFDDQFLYVLKKNQDIIIPLENIESVEIATVGGVYKVNLFHADLIGNFFYFKQSLWYPLNYKQCDGLVNVLRKNIALAKLKKQEPARHALHS